MPELPPPCTASPSPRQCSWASLSCHGALAVPFGAPACAGAHPQHQVELGKARLEGGLPPAPPSGPAPQTRLPFCPRPPALCLACLGIRARQAFCRHPAGGLPRHWHDPAFSSTDHEGTDFRPWQGRGQTKPLPWQASSFRASAIDAGPFRSDGRKPSSPQHFSNVPTFRRQRQ